MSPMGAEAGRSRGRFPRVSGDEPDSVRKELGDVEFSPREWG